MGGECGTYVGEGNAYRILMVKTEGERPVERPKHTWIGNIRNDFKEIVWEGVDWINVGQTAS